LWHGNNETSTSAQYLKGIGDPFSWIKYVPKNLWHQKES